ncbi:MAG: DUF6186 family protein [Acidimicrobiales bacterium]
MAVLVEMVTTASIGIVAWCVLGLVAVGLEILARFTKNGFLTTGQVLHYVMRSTVGRWVVLLGWMWVGWHFFVR